MSPAVSILIPAHNAAPWIDATLESALAQSPPGGEIIVVDDGSTDGTLDRARTFGARGVTILTQPNRGAAAARNAALRAARGDWFQFLDADDLLAPEKLARQLARAGADGPDFAYAARWSRFYASPADAAFPPQRLCVDADPVPWVVEKFEHNAMMHPAAWLISRALAERAGPWDETLSLDDDGEYFTRVVLASRGVRTCQDALSYYRSNLPGSLSSAKSERAWASAWRSLELSAARLQAAEDSPRTQHACATAFQRFIFESYPRAAGCRRTAARRVGQLGGSTLQPEGGRKFHLARRLLGWRLARRLTAGP